MTTFKGKSKLSTVTPADKPGVTVNRRDNKTTGSPLTARVTQQEQILLQSWLTELQQHTNKRLSVGKLLRGLIHMQGEINTKKLIDSITKNT